MIEDSTNGSISDFRRFWITRRVSRATLAALVCSYGYTGYTISGSQLASRWGEKQNRASLCSDAEESFFERSRVVIKSVWRSGLSRDLVVAPWKSLRHTQSRYRQIVVDLLRNASKHCLGPRFGAVRFSCPAGSVRTFTHDVRFCLRCDSVHEKGSLTYPKGDGCPLKK